MTKTQAKAMIDDLIDLARCLEHEQPVEELEELVLLRDRLASFMAGLEG